MAKDRKHNEQEPKIAGDDPIAAQEQAAKRGRRVLSPQEQAERRNMKQAKWRELANQRVPKAIRALNNVRRLANRQSYVFTPEQARTLVSHLKAAVARIEDAFTTEDQAPPPADLF